MNVLVIEDDPTVGGFIRRGLEEQRYRVSLVTNGEEGERVAASESFDVVILDMRLPGKSGLDVLQSLRARDSRPRCWSSRSGREMQGADLSRGRR